MAALQALPALEPPVRVVSSRGALEQMVSAFLDRDHLPLAFDIETTGLDPRAGKLVMLQFYQEGHTVAVVDMRDPRRLPPDAVGPVLAPLFDASLLVLGHNLKFDFGWLMEHLDIFPTRAYDTYLAEQVIRGVGRSDAQASGIDLTLKGLAHSYLGRAMSKAERNWFIDLDQRPQEWNAPFPPEQLTYAALDVALLPLLYREQLSLLNTRNLLDTAKLEMRALPAIATIELSGVKIAVEGWRAFIAEKEQEAREIESEALRVYGAAILQARTEKYDRALAEYDAYQAAKGAYQEELKVAWEADPADGTDTAQPWGKFKTVMMQTWRAAHPPVPRPKPDTSLPNLGSPAQLREAFRVLGIAVTSTDSETLQGLEDDYPEVKLLLDYRKASKFVQSFGEALLQYVVNGRIHPEYVQIGASTGRMSCTRPNWQQVPSKGDGKKLRALVVAEEGNKLLTADFSNIELRILADITGDATMLRLFSEGYDLHSYTARMMFGLEESVDVEHELMPGSDKTYRYVAKTINFGLVYGMSPTKLAKTLRVSRERAQELMESYFRLYPGVARWMQQMREAGVRNLTSVTLSGRKRYYTLPADPTPPTSRHPSAIQEYLEARREANRQRSRIERQAMNTPIQGTSADITKLALALLYEGGLFQNGLNLARIVAVVHDEIVIETPAQYVELVKAAQAEAMEQAAKTYLKRVHLPPVKVVPDDHWAKE